MQQLPIGIQSFSRLRQGDFLNLLADFYTQCPADQRVQLQQDQDEALHQGSQSGTDGWGYS